LLHLVGINSFERISQFFYSLVRWVLL